MQEDPLLILLVGDSRFLGKRPDSFHMSTESSFRRWGYPTPKITQENFDSFVEAYNRFCGVGVPDLPDKHFENRSNVLRSLYCVCVGRGVWLDGVFPSRIEKVFHPSAEEMEKHFRFFQNRRLSSMWLTNLQWVLNQKEVGSLGSDTPSEGGAQSQQDQYGQDALLISDSESVMRQNVKVVYEAFDAIESLGFLRVEVGRLRELFVSCEEQILESGKIEVLRDAATREDALMFTGLLPYENDVVSALMKVRDDLHNMEVISGVPSPNFDDFIVRMCASAYVDGHRDFSVLAGVPELLKRVLVEIDETSAEVLSGKHREDLTRLKAVGVLLIKESDIEGGAAARRFASNISALFFLLFHGYEGVQEVSSVVALAAGFSHAEKLRKRHTLSVPGSSPTSVTSEEANVDSKDKEGGVGEQSSEGRVKEGEEIYLLGKSEHEAGFAAGGQKVTVFEGVLHHRDAVKKLQVAAKLCSNVLLVGSPGVGQRLLARKYSDAVRMFKGNSGSFVEYDVFRFTANESQYPERLFKEAADGVFLVENLDRHLLQGANQGVSYLELFRAEMSTRSRSVVVVATAKEESLDALQAENPDLYRRFVVVNLQDYTPEELTDIAVRLFEEKDLFVSEEAQSSMKEYFSFKRQVGNLRNARKAEALVKNVLFNRTENEHKIKGYTEEESSLGDAAAGVTIQASDIPQPGELTSVSVQDSFDELIGLDNIKQEVRLLFAEAATQSRRLEAGVKLEEPMRHMVFSGAPGTGKTTVARLIGKVFVETGLLASGHVVEVGRKDLVAGYLGQSGPKVADVVQRALGGVLFIDEAYSIDGGKDNDRNGRLDREVIDTLVKLMEDHRHELVVIVAGYTDPMERFLSNNPGLASRFSKTLTFQDYSDNELVKVFEKFAGDANMVLASGVQQKLAGILSVTPKGKSFGNARFMRTLFEHSVTWQAVRLLEDEDADATTLLPQDIHMPQNPSVSQHSEPTSE